MEQYEYKIVPAPTRGRKGPGVKGAEGRFAHGLELAINALAAEGWSYLRSEILPSEERQGLTSSQTIYRSVLVFRRVVNRAEDPGAMINDTAEPPGMEEDAPSDVADEAATEEPMEAAEAEQPQQLQQRALNSLYTPSDNSKQV